MLTLENISVENIVQAISLESPLGWDVREAKDSSLALYHTLKEMRYNARLNEKRSASEGDTRFIKTSDWEPILKKSIEILTCYSKDIEVASWLVEALVRIYSFQGLAIGINILSSLVIKYSGNLHPQSSQEHEDENELNLTLGFLSGLTGSSSHEGTLLTPILCAPLTQNLMFSLWQFQQAYELEHTNEEDKKQEKIRNGYTDFKKIKSDIKESKSSFLQHTKKYIEESIFNLEELSHIVNDKFTNNNISFTHIKNILNECHRTFVFIAGDYLEPMETDIVQNTSEADLKNSEENSKVAQNTFNEEIEFSYSISPDMQKNNPYYDVERLLKNINFDCIFHPHKYNAPTLKLHTVNLIDYLSQMIKVTDSLSPLPYFLEKAVHISKLSFAEVLTELKLYPHEISHAAFEQLTGIQFSGKEK